MRRFWVTVLLASCTGCLHDMGNVFETTPTAHLPSNPGVEKASVVPQRQVSLASGSSDASTRVVRVGYRVIQANPQLGLHPQFTVAGLPDPEIMHRERNEIILTDGLVQLCPTDNLLAAVIALELGKMVAEREAQQAYYRRVKEKMPAMSVPLGGSSVSGSPDRTELVDHLKTRGDHKRNEESGVVGPDPEVQAKTYLSRAGFNESDLESAAHVIRAAESGSALHKLYK